MAWIGRKKIAFIPVFRPHAAPPDAIPPDWTGDILRRVFFDPDAKTGLTDRYGLTSKRHHRDGLISTGS